MSRERRHCHSNSLGIHTNPWCAKDEARRGVHHQYNINSLPIVRARRRSSSGNTRNVLGRDLGMGYATTQGSHRVPIRYSQLAKPSLRTTLCALSLKEVP